MLNLTAAPTAVLPIGPLPGAVPALLECGAAAGAALLPGTQPRSFADLLDAAEPGDGIAVPEAGVTVSADGLDVPAWAEMPMPQNCAEPGPAEPPAVAQPWAWVLVPELANLPALLPPEYAAPVGDSASPPPAGLANTADGPWPLRAAAGSAPRLALAALAAGRPRGWQASLPAAAEAAPPSASPAAPAPVLRNATGQPIPFPTADQPPWFDPVTPPAWFDPANPPPAWPGPARDAPSWYDPARVPPAWLDPARVPAAWFAPAQTAPAPAPAAQMAETAAAPPIAALLPAAVLRRQPPPAVAPGAAAEPAARSGRIDAPVPADLPPSPASGPQPPAAFVAAPPLRSPLPLNAAAATAPELPAGPALAITSGRLGEVAVQLIGTADELQVMVQAQPAAAALIGAEAPRLQQDLAAAGVALAGLSVNGQRTDLAGGQRDRQRQSARRGGDDVIAAARLNAARPAHSADRFA